MSKKNRGRRKKGKPKTGSVYLEPCRKTRTRTKKPKYLSLVHLEENQPLISFIRKNCENRVKRRKLNNLFPIRPEPGRIFVGRVMDTQYDNVSLLFDTTEEDNARAITLNGLLDDDSRSSDCCYKNETTTQTTTATITSEEIPLSPSSLTYGFRFEDHDHTRASALVRTAMKGRITKEEGEEKWVVYSEVVEKKEMEEVSSCGGGRTRLSSSSSSKKIKLLALKLDYEEIMNAWSDKGPLYIEGEPPQTVPDLHVRS